MIGVNVMVGAWEVIENIPACSLPEQVATGFSEVTANMLGAKYVPVLYCATQIVAGINHMIICEQTLATHPEKKHIVKMVLNQAPGEDLVGKFSIVSISQIV